MEKERLIQPRTDERLRIMNILVTGAKGMVGTALCNNLRNIRDGKNRTRPGIYVEEIFEYDLDSTEAELDEYCRRADFVFNLAGVNRPENPDEFMQGNFGFASVLLDALKKHGNTATVMLRRRSRRRFRDASETASTAGAKRRGRSCFLLTARTPAQRLRSIVS